MAETSYFCDVALSYAVRGFEVFPLAPGSKVPLIPARKGGKGLDDATANPRTIKRWWSACPDANVAARTGITFDVVDLDGPQAIDSRLEPPKLPGSTGLPHQVAGATV